MTLPASEDPMSTDLARRPEALPVSPATVADRNPALVYLGRLAPGSRRTMRGALDALAARLTGGSMDALTLPWGELRYQHTAKLRADLMASGAAPSTVNKHLAALRGVLREAWRLGLMPAEEYRQAVDLEGIRGTTPPAGRALTDGELRALFASCPRDSVSGIRDAALLAVLYGAGLRRSEAVALECADYDRDTGTLTVRRGKGNKARTVYATNGGKRALDAWIEARGQESGSLFCPVSRGGVVTVAPMTGQAVLWILRRAASRAKVARFSPHDLRRTFIGDLLDAGADLVTVQALAGHANVQTTARYDRRGERVKLQAAGMLHVPYGR
jgi:integrase